MKSKQVFNGFQAAVNYLFVMKHPTKSREVLPNSIANAFKNFGKNYKRTRRQAREAAPRNTYKEHIGKDFFTPQAMVFISKLAHTKFGSVPLAAVRNGVFASACTNCAGRGDSTGAIKYARTMMNSDSMSVKFGTKTDHDGDREDYKAMHANPFSPWTCWFFNIGLQTLASSDAHKSEYLCGDKSKKKSCRGQSSTIVDSFSTWLRQTLNW
jgi:hypothetical protein